MKVIYIAGRFRGKTAWDVEQNIRRAEDVAFNVACLGAMPLCPHTNTRFFDGTLTAEFWLSGTMELMKRCDAVFLVSGYEDSEGSKEEVVKALELNMPVFYPDQYLDLENFIDGNK
jgi:hypothetical protein